jgi:nucleotide-binding universal stress UspA family protein
VISVLIPVEEGRDAAGAVRHAIELYRADPVRIYLLNVRTPLPSYVARFIPQAERHAYHHENGMRAMQQAIERLDEAGIAHRDHVLVGDKAETIMAFAREHHCAQIIIDKRGGGLLEGLGLGSIREQLHHLLRPGDSLQIREGT